MLISTFLDKLNTTPDLLEFSETMAVIEANYLFTEAKFFNGKQKNEAGQNSGSCKLFAFALLEKLSQQQTLACFGRFYREDVLQNINAEDHQNIRQFMINGWHGLRFNTPALTTK